MTQREIAEALGITQPAVSQQLKFAPKLADIHAEDLLEAAAPVLKALAAKYGYRRLAVFGSFGFVRFQQLIEQVLGRQVDLVSYGGLKPRIDDDIREEAVML